MGLDSCKKRCEDTLGPGGNTSPYTDGLYVGHDAYEDLPVQPPVKVDKIWTITKTKTALVITCNNVEVLNLVFADSSSTYCVSRWGDDVVEQIKFPSSDTASDFYSAALISAN
eukprot:sb/3476938/